MFDGYFTPLIFGTNGGMGAECILFIKTLAEKLSTTQNEEYSTVIAWIRIRLSFEILKSVNLRVRVSRVHFTKGEILEDFKLNVATTDIMLNYGKMGLGFRRRVGGGVGSFFLNWGLYGKNLDIVLQLFCCCFVLFWL